jgi:hypothetical protein
VVRGSLQQALKALRGLVVMSPDLEAVAYSLYDNQVGEGGGAEEEAATARVSVRFLGRRPGGMMMPILEVLIWVPALGSRGFGGGQVWAKLADARWACEKTVMTKAASNEAGLAAGLCVTAPQ